MEALRTERDILDWAAADFGGIVTERPRAVLRPESADDISAVLGFAAERNIPVAARGRGHSGFGQAQARDGIVIDMTGLGRVLRVEDDRVVAEAGATWGEVLRATLAHDRTPPVLTDYLGVSVGGTLSAGGISGTTHRYGVQTDTVLSLDVLTGDGVERTCSRTESPELFHAVRAGYGRCGVIVRATLPLIPAPVRVRRFKIYYPTAAELLTRERQLLHEGRFDFLQGEILPVGGGWTYMLDVAAYDSPADDATLLDGLGYEPARDATEDLAYWDFANRLADAEKLLTQTGEWFAPHAWSNLLLPDNATDPYLADLMAGLTQEDLGAAGLVLTYPVFRRNLTTPLFRVPDEDVVFLVAVIRFGPEPAVDRQLAANRDWYEKAVAAGGTAYPSGAIPGIDWTRQLDPAAAARYDPHGIFRR
ncbi:FAD-binding protein [Amycolatopsis sp. GM8]|uniref:FAD-binding protein n=1 Tax=Amycolatopsis sp. GM8 TaxID=2896530 RepID=UPI001F39530A|nr:FAD-binding protein [Amycolatopsis sp. GM8]